MVRIYVFSSSFVCLWMLWKNDDAPCGGFTTTWSGHLLPHDSIASRVILILQEHEIPQHQAIALRQESCCYASMRQLGRLLLTQAHRKSLLGVACTMSSRVRTNGIPASFSLSLSLILR